MADTGLTGKRVLVLGAGTAGDGMGNGRAAAISYARAGAQVVAVDADPHALAGTVAAIEEEGGAVEGHVCNVADADAVQRLVAAVEGRGGIEVVHNNVGIFRPGGILDSTPKDFRLVFEVNVLGAYHVVRAALPGMIARGGGVITNISSVVSKRYWPGMLIYQVSKAALESLTMHIALETAAKGIRCNAIVVGTIDTPLARDGMRPFFSGEAGMLAALDATSPTGKMGSPWDVANLAVFLASDAASFINGAQIVLDGGSIWRTQ